MAEPRPDPEALLASLRAVEGTSAAGRLKIFLGACAGVGKTYAMLESARQRQGEGVDVVVGIAETHGRQETQALLEGLEILPRREFDYRGVRRGTGPEMPASACNRVLSDLEHRS